MLLAIAIYIAGFNAHQVDLFACMTFGLIADRAKCDWPAGFHFGFKLSLLASLCCLLYGLRKARSRS